MDNEAAVNPLRQWRKTKNLRAVDVALMLGVSERAILAYETGAFKPKNDHVEELAKVMNTPKELLLSQWTTWIKAKRA